MPAPARIQVTPSTIQAFLGNNLSERTWASFYGLHLLNDAQFQQIWDALLNGDCQPEELVRLGTFTAEEVSSFIADVLGNWVSPGVAMPAFGTDGYQYLTQELGLQVALQAAAAGAVTVPGPSPQAFLGVRLYAGGAGDAYPDLSAINSIFETYVLPAAQGAEPYAYFFPQDSSDVLEYVVPAGASSGATTLIQSWYGSIYQPLYGVPASELGTRLICVNEDPTCPLLANPGLAQYLLAEPEIPQSFRLLLMREASVRTANGPYTKSQVSSQIAALQSLDPTFVATSRSMATAYLWQLILPEACANSLEVTPGDSDWTTYATQSAAIAQAYSAMQAYRLRLRGFFLSVYNGAIANLQGSFPPG